MQVVEDSPVDIVDADNIRVSPQVREKMDEFIVNAICYGAPSSSLGQEFLEAVRDEAKRTNACLTKFENDREAIAQLGFGLLKRFVEEPGNSEYRAHLSSEKGGYEIALTDAANGLNLK